MFIIVEATYEGGVLKLHKPLPIDEHATVRVTVQTDKSGPTGAAIARHEPALIEPAVTDLTRAGSPPADEPTDFAESEMLDIWLKAPPSKEARTVTATRGEPIFPQPFVIDESNVAPE